MARTKSGRRLAAVVPATAIVLAGSQLVAPDLASAQVRGELAVESRIFPRSGLSGQDRFAGSLRLNPGYDRSWSNGRQLLVVELFGRIDQQDRERTHFDVRQLAWEMAAESWELRVGIRRVFWGVTESQHLVDIINQTDLVEDPDGEDKLGQPMINVAFVRSWGTLDLYVLPWFRERRFAGRDGRLRPGLPIDTDRTTYAAGAGRRHVDLAARWTQQAGDWDIGISYFRGTGRDPALDPVVTPGGATVLAPRYSLIDQAGIDVQYTHGGWLGKLEAIARRGEDDRYLALTTGFEYTIGAAFGSAMDLGLLAEYLWDERGSMAPTPFEDDLFLGARLAFNDVQSTQLLGGAILDRTGEGALMTVEGSRRLGDTWSISLRGLAVVGAGARSPLSGLRRDDYVEIGITRHF